MICIEMEIDLKINNLENRLVAYKLKGNKKLDLHILQNG
jgi:hypothetical protein